MTANLAILGSISGAGLALKTFSESKDYKRKIEMSNFSYTTYEKVLLGLRTSLRGGTFNKDDFLKELTVLDETVVDFTPLVKFDRQYAKKFLSRPIETALSLYRERNKMADSCSHNLVPRALSQQ